MLKKFKHDQCIGVRGIKTFKCAKCDKPSNNYMNGVDLCSECCDQLGLCCICGSKLNADKPVKKLFISQPMRGLSEEEILREREEIKRNVKSKIEEFMGEPVEVIDSYFQDYPGESCKSIPIWYLGKSIKLLSEADIVYFGGDWRNARGCRIEHKVAEEYGIQIIEE